MEKKTKIIIASVSAIVIGIGAYFIFRKPASLLPSGWVDFDWIGKNSDGKGNAVAGFHTTSTYPEGTMSGSKIEIKVASGDSSYNGIYDVVKTGADDNSFPESMVLLNIPVTGKPASGQLRLVA